MTLADFNELVRKLSRKLYRYAYRILKEQGGAEDAVQEVMLKLWQMNSKLGEYNSIEALATTMTKNFCIDQVRKFRRVDSLEKEPDTGSRELSPHDLMVRMETSTIMGRIIGELPEIYRDVIQLRDIEGFSYEEIAGMTGQNVNTLRVNLSRARKTVRNEFIKYTYERGGNKKASGEVL
ncbi:MAG: RNA polymerase sigma factor [Bacteroidales bacterium]